MVATRRGSRVCSPSKTNQDQSSNVQATPSTGRTTRNTAKKAENPPQHASVETCSQLDKVEGHRSPTSSVKRCTRASRLHGPEQPSSPVGSVHEADVSDVESCCSAVSDIQPPLTGTGQRQRQPRVSQEDDDMSEVESCSSAVSAPRVGRSTRRSLRRKKIPEGSDASHLESESCSSVPSEFQRVTRSQRKTASARSCTKQQTDSDLSDTDVSGVSRSELSKSTSRRVTRSRKPTGPIPIHLDEASESSLSPGPTSRKSRASRGKKAAIVIDSESQSCDSEGFESGPTRGVATRRPGQTKALDSDSDSELSLVHSPMGSSCSTQSRGTPPCSAQGTPSSIRSTKHLKVLLEQSEEPAAVNTSLNDSRLESTVIALDGDDTLLEENESQTLEGRENDGVSGEDPTSSEADTTRAEKVVNVITEEESLLSDMPLVEAVSKPAVSVRGQQGELCADANTSEIEVMQEAVHSSDESKPGHLCERTSDLAEDTGEKSRAKDAADVDAADVDAADVDAADVDAADVDVADVDTHPSQRDEAVVEEGVQQSPPSEQEVMRARTSRSDTQQADASNEAQVESVQIRSSDPVMHDITDSGPERQPVEVTVQNTNMISLLVSSDDEEEEEEEEEMEVCDDEGEGEMSHTAEDGGGPSNESEAAGSSVGGLFVIDTRPGQEADEHYYVEEPTEEMKATKEKKVEEDEEEEEQDDEFVDEEGDDDDDDEDANILFSCRNPLLKEMSSRIDPGMRMKELGGLYINFDGSKSKPVSSSLQKVKEKKIQDEVMKKSVIGPDFEKKDAVPPYSESKRVLKLKHRVEREKSTGDGWFNMKAPEITQELKGDLQVLKMRGSLDPKRFYKKNDRDGFPKFFQVGTVVDNPVDFYHSRIPKKERKRTMVEELLADAEFRHNNKKKFHQIIVEKAAQGAGKRNKKRNKVHKK